eukprot:1075126-Prymnesium_polylepis.1
MRKQVPSHGAPTYVVSAASPVRLASVRTATGPHARRREFPRDTGPARICGFEYTVREHRPAPPVPRLYGLEHDSRRSMCGVSQRSLGGQGCTLGV